MLYFVFLTRRCNLTCKYCGDTQNPVFSIPQEIEYSLDTLLKFLKLDPNPIIAFYGGEPLLNINDLKKIMDKLENAIFLLQTNGIILDRLDSEYLQRIQTLLVSIDGTESTNDHNRGKGTYAKILRNLKYIRKSGFEGDLIARMTVSTRTEIYSNVTHLLSLKDPLFDHIHWQLDVIWSDRNQWQDFDNWVQASYNPGISRLVKDWLNLIKGTNRIPGIVPFLGIMNTLLTNNPTRLRYRAGIDAFAIQPNGALYACPVCPEFDDFKVGDIYTKRPQDIRESLLIQSPCLECEVYSICGGRCLFANRHNFWKNDFSKVCLTIKHLISELRKVKPIVERMIDTGKITLKMFGYPPYNNSCEIIP
ncbi:MAG: TIGR04084 family radical SAM/SPASM domain-containing protein [Candidatus Heimdallarchaeota archaeon]|nr:MAG: TIGR04084 family radical SAM/SPASM domain-containing protein [Candidatus Heimdallarchaeota archaeon]